MKKIPAITEKEKAKKGYNEHNPGQSQGAFPPASGDHNAAKNDTKSNAADKKKKEDRQ